MKTTIVALAFAMAPVTASAQTYVEAVDAGQTLATATDLASGPGGPLTAIVGSMPSRQDADLYRIYINAPASFSATTANNGTDAFFDTALFLFDAAGRPIATNDDLDGTSLNSALPVGNLLYRNLLAGIYYLGISQSGNEPENGGGPTPPNQLLFAPYTNGDTTSVRGAAGGINPTTLDHFNGRASFDDAGPYRIDLTGVTFGAPNAAAVPEPAAWLLMLGGFALTGIMLRRRGRVAHAAA